MNNNNRLPNETLSEIFNIIVQDTKDKQKHEEQRRHKKIYEYNLKCEVCITLSNILEVQDWIQHAEERNMSKIESECLRTDYHYKIHKKLEQLDNISIQSKNITEHFTSIYSSMRTCKAWRHAYKHKYRDIYKQYEGLHTITKKVIEAMVQDPVQSTWSHYYNYMYQKICSKYKYSSNVLALNTYFRNKHYDEVVTTEAKKIIARNKASTIYEPRRHCVLCKHSTTEQYEP